jgi:hypothetical protein
MSGTWPDPAFRYLSPALLASLSADDVSGAIVQHVELVVAERGEDDRDEVIDALPIGTKAIYATALVNLEVNNGGFNQFFFNSSGRLAGVALAGYELMGADDYASVMRAAIATHEAEREVMRPYYDENTIESFSESYEHTDLDEADQRYYSLGDRIYDIWALFVRERPDYFK